MKFLGPTITETLLIVSAICLPLTAQSDDGFIRMLPEEVPFKPPLESALSRRFCSATKLGVYVIRVRFPPGAHSSPHFHSQDRHVTVIKGTCWMGVGDELDFNKAVPMKAGLCSAPGASSSLGWGGRRRGDCPDHRNRPRRNSPGRASARAIRLLAETEELARRRYAAVRNSSVMPTLAIGMEDSWSNSELRVIGICHGHRTQWRKYEHPIRHGLMAVLRRSPRALEGSADPWRRNWSTDLRGASVAVIIAAVVSWRNAASLTSAWGSVCPPPRFAGT